jgi:hypothetical protein
VYFAASTAACSRRPEVAIGLRVDAAVVAGIFPARFFGAPVLAVGFVVAWGFVARFAALFDATDLGLARLVMAGNLP